MSDYQDLFGMFGGTGSCPPPPQPGPCPPPPGPCPPPQPGPCPPSSQPGPGPIPQGQGFGSGGLILWLIILLFLFRGGFGNNSSCGGSGNVGNGNTGCGCGNNNYVPVMPVYETGCCTTMVPNPCDYTEYCNCCGKKVKKSKKQKNYIVEVCQCGGNLPVANENCGSGNAGGGFECGNGYGFWWIIILIILFCFRGGNGFVGGAPCPPVQPQPPCGC